MGNCLQTLLSGGSMGSMNEAPSSAKPRSLRTGIIITVAVVLALGIGAAIAWLRPERPGAEVESLPPTNPFAGMMTTLGPSA